MSVIQSTNLIRAELGYLDKEVTNLFMQYDPALDRIFQNMIAIEEAKSRNHYFDVMVNAPGIWSAASGGAAVINRQLPPTVLVQGSTPDFRAIFAIMIDNGEVDRVHRQSDAIDLVDLYIVGGLEKAAQDLSTVFLSGVAIDPETGAAQVSEITEAPTLCGDHTWDSGAEPGILDFAAPGSQTSTVFGLVKRGGASGLRQWYNQYGAVTDVNVDGWDVLRRTYGNCSIRNNVQQNPDLCILDRTSLYNLDVADNSYVQVVTVDKSPERRGPELKGLKMENMEIIWSENLKPQWMGGGVATGVIADGRQGAGYILNTKTWNFINFMKQGAQGNDKRARNKLLYLTRPFSRLQDQDASAVDWTLDFGLRCKHLRGQGTLEGFWNGAALPTE